MADDTARLTERFGTQSADIIGELQSMLRIFNTDPQELFFKWESYCLRMGPENTKLDLNTLNEFKKTTQEQLEREMKGKAKMSHTPAVQRTARPQNASDSFALFDGMLAPSTPARGGAAKRKIVAGETPRNGKSARTLDQPSSPAAPSSPLRSPAKNVAEGESTPFNQRDRPGEVLEALNPTLSKPEGPLDESFESRIGFLFNMEIKNFSYRPMYQKLMEASEVQDERIDEFAMSIQEHYGLDDDAFGDPTMASPHTIVAVGRIASDSLEGKFNPSSIVLESSRMTGAGARIPLKLEKLSSFSFFPGQIVALKGVNSSGDYFQVHEVMDPPKLPPASTSTADLAATADRLAAGPVRMFIASGPYTTQDNLNFEALDELIRRAQEQRPDVIILTGPFIDSEHPLVQSGDFDLEDIDMMNDGTVDDLFRQEISRRLQQIKHSMVILIPSLRDAVSKHCAYPQDNFKRKALDLPTNIKCLPNPSMFSLNETVFAVSTNDILFHLQREEISWKPAIPNPPARLASHILSQRNFYPLFPPPSREILPPGLRATGAALDIPHTRLADLVNVTPDVLVLPSMLGHFAKIVDGVVVINPGSASKPRAAGTWVEMTIAAPSADATKDEEVAHRVWERARVEVRRI